MTAPRDLHRRPLRSLRLSVTDRCNLRCGYCMPEERYAWLPKADILSYEESTALVAELMGLGLDRVRVTGGEPLLRRDLPDLVAALAALEAPGPDGRPARLRDIALTTNAVHLPARAAALRDAGLHRLTVSLDTLDPARFRRMTRRDELAATLAGLDAAREAGFRGTKLNTVLMRGENDDELEDLVRFAAARDLELRLIEYMDVGGATRWTMDAVVPAAEMLARLGAAFGGVEPLEPERTAAPADRFRLGTGQVVGIIASTTRPFCSSCDRARLTADGRFFTCLYAEDGTPLAPVLRAEGAAAAARVVADTWTRRDDRGAERRLAAIHRGAWIDADDLKGRPHLEMHTRGG